LKAQEEFMSLINSTISHEMRNPLNSIISQCKIQEDNINELFVYIEENGKNDPKLKKIADDMTASNNIQKTSASLLQFHVEDTLGLAQIKAGKF